MKKNYIKLIIIEILMLLVIAFNAFISGVFTSTNTNYVLVWVLALLALIGLMGFEKDRHLYKTDVLQIIFIYSTIYLIATYVFGFFFGFVRSPYSMEPLRMLQNIFPVLIILVLQELVRYVIVSKGKGSKLIMAAAVLLFIMFDVSLGMGSYVITDAMGIFELIGLLILPSITRNLLLTYLTYKNGYKAPILYRIIFDLIIYVLPIYPDLGIYFESILGFVFPIILFLKLNTFLAKAKPTTIRVSKIRKFLFWLPTITVLAVLVILVSGIFKVYAMAIGSASMEPRINKGDAIIIEKLTDEELRNLQLGDIIAYEHDNKIIVHRIVDIRVENNKYIFNTKGDNNDDVDKYDIEQRHVKGLVRFKIPYIGYPSVWLGELLK